MEGLFRLSSISTKYRYLHPLCFHFGSSLSGWRRCSILYLGVAEIIYHSVLLSLHILLFIYSFSGIFSKYASHQEFFDTKFIFLYLGLLLILVIYAIGWQQVIRRLPLSTAFAHKSVTIIWSTIWGILFFQEEISLGKCVGILMVMTGVILFSKSEEG